MKKLLSALSTLIILIVLGFFSLFLYANAYEQIALTDLPFVDSVTFTKLPSLVIGYDQSQRTDEEKYGFFGRPVTLRIPRLNYAVNLFDAVESGGQWVVGKNSQSVVYMSESKAGRLGDLIIFGQKERKIMQYERELSEGDRLTLETIDGWKYHFRVTNKGVVARDSSYLPADYAYSRLILLSEIDDSQVLVVEATYLKMEEI